MSVMGPYYDHSEGNQSNGAEDRPNIQTINDKSTTDDKNFNSSVQDRKNLMSDSKTTDGTL